MVVPLANDSHIPKEIQCLLLLHVILRMVRCSDAMPKDLLSNSMSEMSYRPAFIRPW